MGAAAYNRGSASIARYFDEIRGQTARTNDARAALWKKLLLQGAILTFEAAGGAVVTAGPHHTATGEGSMFSCYREDGDARWRGAWYGSAWSIALYIVEHAGRKAPVRIAQGRAPAGAR